MGKKIHSIFKHDIVRYCILKYSTGKSMKLISLSLFVDMNRPKFFSVFFFFFFKSFSC